MTQTGSLYTLNLPTASSAQWQAQFFIIPNSLVLSSETNYDFSCILTSNTDIAKATVKLTDKTNDGNFLFSEEIALAANTPTLVKLSDLSGIDADCKLVMDFGGNPAGTVVKVRDIVLKDHAYNDGSDFNGFNYEHAANMWRPFEEKDDMKYRFWYAPGWNQTDDPKLTKEGSKYTLHFPTATTDTWQAQCFFTPSGLRLTSEKKYDFSCIFTSTTAQPHITVKLTDVNSAGNFLFSETVEMAAGETKLFYLSNLAGIDATCELVLDFGGNGDDCTVTIDRITIKDHSVDDGTVIPGGNVGPTPDELAAMLEKAYKTYEAKCNEIKADLEQTDYNCDEADILIDYLTMEQEPDETYPNGTSLYILANKELDLEGITAETEWLDSLYRVVINTALKEGTDVTYFVTNSDMSQASFKGWEIDITQHGWEYNANSGTGMDFWPVAESWNTAFDCHQTIEDMPNGLYEIGIYAYYRPGGDETYIPDAIIPCELYMNDFYTPIMNITDDPLAEEDAVDGVNCRLTPNDNVKDQDWSVEYLSPFGYLPKGEWASSYAFRAGRYYQKVYGIVTDGKMTIGIRNTGEPWYENGVAYWSKFKVIYMGKNEEALDNVIESYKKRAETLMAQEEYYYYHALNDQLTASIEAALAATDKDSKYESVIAINEVFNKISASAAVYNDLVSAAEAFVAYLFNDDYGLTETEKDEYYQLYTDTWEAISQGTLTDEEATQKAAELRAIDLETAISQAKADVQEAILSIYTMDGQRLSTSMHNLKPGMYIIRSAARTSKVLVK